MRGDGQEQLPGEMEYKASIQGREVLTVQIRIMCINRGEQLHSEPSIMSLLSLVDIPFLLILHLLCLSVATPHQSVLHSSLTSQETAHPGPCSRLMRSSGGRSEGRKGGVGVSPLKWQELGTFSVAPGQPLSWYGVPRQCLFGHPITFTWTIEGRCFPGRCFPGSTLTDPFPYPRCPPNQPLPCYALHH